MSEKVLIIDDNPEDRYLIGHKIKQENIPFDTAESAEEAYEKLAVGEYTIVFIDLILPRMSGFDLISKLRAEARFNNLYLWVVSNIREDEAIRKAIDIGADDYLAKPIDPMILRDKLRVIVKDIDARTLPVCPIDAEKGYAKVEFNLPLNITEFHEDQIFFETEYIVNKGSVYELSGYALSGLPDKKLRVLVEDCQQLDSTSKYNYQVVGSIYEMSDEIFGLYRTWLLRNRDVQLNQV